MRVEEERVEREKESREGVQVGKERLEKRE